MSPKPKKPTEAEYKKAACGLAFDFAPRIYPCLKCGWPVAKGFCCGTCGTYDPDSAEDAKDESPS